MFDVGKVVYIGGGSTTSVVEVIDLNVPKPAWTVVSPMKFGSASPKVGLSVVSRYSTERKTLAGLRLFFRPINRRPQRSSNS
jgi:hypothetical protein